MDAMATLLLHDEPFVFSLVLLERTIELETDWTVPEDKDDRTGGRDKSNS
jgi:hypothetical protein